LQQSRSASQVVPVPPIALHPACVLWQAPLIVQFPGHHEVPVRQHVPSMYVCVFSQQRPRPVESAQNWKNWEQHAELPQGRPQQPSCAVLVMWVREEGGEEEGELTPPHVPGGHAGGG
jgi:hypothetical protein